MKSLLPAAERASSHKADGTSVVFLLESDFCGECGEMLSPCEVPDGICFQCLERADALEQEDRDGDLEGGA